MIDEEQMRWITRALEWGEYIDPSITDELLRLIRLGLWAEKHGVPALDYVKHRTEQSPEQGMHPHGFIRSTRMRGVVVEALKELQELRKFAAGINEYFGTDAAPIAERALKELRGSE